jgi:hypothetical protein
MLSGLGENIEIKEQNRKFVCMFDFWDVEKRKEKQRK